MGQPRGEGTIDSRTKQTGVGYFGNIDSSVVPFSAQLFLCCTHSCQKKGGGGGAEEAS